MEKMKLFSGAKESSGKIDVEAHGAFLFVVNDTRTVPWRYYRTRSHLQYARTSTKKRL